MRARVALLLGFALYLAPTSADANCTMDSDCAHLGTGATCDENTGVCYYGCAAGTKPCGDSTRYCVPIDRVCCAPQGHPDISCPSDHFCCEGGTCDLKASCPGEEENPLCEVFGCEAGKEDSVLAPLAMWVVMAIVLARRRRRPRDAKPRTATPRNASSVRCDSARRCPRRPARPPTPSS